MVLEFLMPDEPTGLAAEGGCAGLLVHDCSFARVSWQGVVPAAVSLVKAEVFAGVEEELPFSSFDDSVWPALFACL
jgi:hypothetical protein